MSAEVSKDWGGLTVVLALVRVFFGTGAVAGTVSSEGCFLGGIGRARIVERVSEGRSVSEAQEQGDTRTQCEPDLRA